MRDEGQAATPNQPVCRRPAAMFLAVLTGTLFYALLASGKIGTNEIAAVGPAARNAMNPLAAKTEPEVDPVGKITVETVPPGARVCLEEEYLGRAPLLDIPIPVGRHSLVLVDQGGYRKQLWINVREGKTLTYVVVMGD